MICENGEFVIDWNMHDYHDAWDCIDLHNSLPEGFFDEETDCVIVNLTLLKEPMFGKENYEVIADVIEHEILHREIRKCGWRIAEFGEVDKGLSETKAEEMMVYLMQSYPLPVVQQLMDEHYGRMYKELKEGAEKILDAFFPEVKQKAMNEGEL